MSDKGEKKCVVNELIEPRKKKEKEKEKCSITINKIPPFFFRGLDLTRKFFF